MSHLKPIAFEMEFKMKHEPPQDGSFCERCFVTSSINRTKTSLPIRTGCNNEICRIDLQIFAQVDATNLVLGETELLEISYNIQNMGESAYMTKLLISGLADHVSKLWLK
jgi:Integrin alpha